MFFPLPEAAERAGFRPCRRCRPKEAAAGDPQADLVRRVCHWIETSGDGPISLRDLAAEAGVSPSHLQRTFKRMMGITPHQYAEACRLRRLKSLVRKGTNVTRALYEAGYGSSSRLYEGVLRRMGMTPGKYLKGGKGMHVRYTIVNCPLGRLLIAATDKGVSAVSIGKSDHTLEAALFSEYPAAEIHRDKDGLGEYVTALLKSLDSGKPHLDLPLDIQVTAFQRRVYEALRTIALGQTRSYQEIANTIGHPGAARAVARACATNPAAIIIPCHRVVRQDGTMGGYRWGIEAKQALLNKEKSENGRVSVHREEDL